MPEQKDSIDAFAATALITFSGMLGLNQALVKIVNAGFAPVFQSGLRSACAFLPVLIFALLTRKRLSVTDGCLALGLVNGLLFSLEFCLIFLALDYTTVARASLFFYTQPIWVALGAHLLIPGERLSMVRVLGLSIAVGGVALVLSVESTAPRPDAWIGDILSLVAAIFWAGIAIVTRATRLARCTSEMNLLYQLGVSAVLLIAISPLFGDLIRDVTPTILGIFTFQVLAIASLGFLVWLWILARYPVSNMASFALLAPVFGIFFGWLIFDDQITVEFVAALGLVGLGIYLVNRKPRAATSRVPQREA